MWERRGGNKNGSDGGKEWEERVVKEGRVKLGEEG